METTKTTHTEQLLKTQGLAVGYTKTIDGALYKDLNLSLNKGRLVCLMGPNGAGKSTLLKTLTGLQKPIAGDVVFQNNPDLLKNPKKRAKTFSIVLTGSPPGGLLKARELVALGRHPHTGWAGNYDKKDMEQIRWALEAVHAEGLAERMVHTLSDGERQRVMVARALAQNTPIIFLDEPTAFLDLSHKIELMHIFRKLTHSCNLTLLMSTHDLELSLQYADELWLMNSNQSCECGSPEDLLLSGSLEKIFGSEELVFDRERGVFHAETELRRFASVTGDRIGVRWTQNALNKIGIGVINDPHNDLKIMVNETESDTFKWEVQLKDQSFIAHSITDLIETIQHQRD